MSRDQDTLPGGWGGLLEPAPVVASCRETVKAGPGEVLLEATGGHDGLGGPLQL